MRGTAWCALPPRPGCERGPSASGAASGAAADSLAIADRRHPARCVRPRGGGAGTAPTAWAGWSRRAAEPPLVAGAASGRAGHGRSRDGAARAGRGSRRGRVHERRRALRRLVAGACVRRVGCGCRNHWPRFRRPTGGRRKPGASAPVEDRIRLVGASVSPGPGLDQSGHRPSAAGGSGLWFVGVAAGVLCRPRLGRRGRRGGRTAHDSGSTHVLLRRLCRVRRAGGRPVVCGGVLLPPLSVLPALGRAARPDLRLHARQQAQRAAGAIGAAGPLRGPFRATGPHVAQPRPAIVRRPMGSAGLGLAAERVFEPGHSGACGLAAVVALAVAVVRPGHRRPRGRVDRLSLAPRALQLRVPWAELERAAVPVARVPRYHGTRDSSVDPCGGVHRPRPADRGTLARHTCGSRASPR